MLHFTGSQLVGKTRGGKGGGVKGSGKTGRLKRRVKAIIPVSSDFAPTLFPCPGCTKPLPAREWINPKNSKQKRVQVETPIGRNL